MNDKGSKRVWSVIVGVSIVLITGGIIWLTSSVLDHNTDLAEMSAHIEALDDGIERLERDMDNIEALLRERRDVSVITYPDSVVVDPERLIVIVKETQAEKVFDSYGVQRGQNFTEEDLAGFRQRRVPDQIVAELRQDNNFIEVVLAIRDMTPSRRQDLLDRCAST